MGEAVWLLKQGKQNLKHPILRSQRAWELQGLFEVMPWFGIAVCSVRNKGSTYCGVTISVFVRVVISIVIVFEFHIGIIIHDYY